MSKHTPERIRQAQDLAAEFGHLNKNIQSLTDLYFSAPDMLSALREQHDAMDMLFARIIQLDTSFFPSRSGAWKAMIKGNKAIAKAEGK